MWLWWVVAGVVGWGVGWGLGWSEVEFLSVDVAAAEYGGVVVGVTVAGVLQWLVLRQRMARAAWWIVASLVSGVVAGGVIYGVGGDAGFSAEVAGDLDVGWVIEAGLYGAVLGVLQWLVLRGQVALSGLWVLASIVGWVVGDPVCSSLMGVRDVKLGRLRGRVRGDYRAGAGVVVASADRPQRQWRRSLLPRAGERTTVDWRWWFWWVLASTVGWAVGGGLSGSLGSIQVGYVGGMTVGAAGAGMLQWLVLRQRIDRAGWWVLATVLVQCRRRWRDRGRGGRRG